MIMRLIIAVSIVLTLLTSAAGAAELYLADFLSPTHPYQEKVYGVMGKMIKEATGGEYTLKVFPGGALGGNPAEQYDRALRGVADITFAVPGYTASKFPMTLLTELPGVIDEKDATAKVWENIDHIKGEYKRVHLLSFWTNGENVLYTREKPVRSLADVKGMKIRVPSRNAGLLVESWGAVPISMPVPEVYNAMQTGVIDAILIDSTATYAFKFGEVSKYLTKGMNGSISPFVLFMNRRTYDEMSDAHKAAFDKIGREIALIANKVQLEGTAYGLKLFGETKGKEIITLTPEAAAEFDATSAGVIANAIAEMGKNAGKAQAFIDALTK